MSSYDPARLTDEAIRFRTTSTTTALWFQSTSEGCGATTIDDVVVSCTRPTPAA